MMILAASLETGLTAGAGDVVTKWRPTLFRKMPAFHPAVTILQPEP